MCLNHVNPKYVCSIISISIPVKAMGEGVAL